MCRITICQQKMEFLTDRTKISQFAKNIATRGTTPASRPGVTRCSLCSQTFARPLLFYCWSLHVIKNNVSVVKMTFRQIAHVINFRVGKSINFFFWAICQKFHSTHFSTQTFSTNCTDPPFNT